MCVWIRRRDRVDWRSNIVSKAPLAYCIQYSGCYCVYIADRGAWARVWCTLCFFPHCCPLPYTTEKSERCGGRWPAGGKCSAGTGRFGCCVRWDGRAARSCQSRAWYRPSLPSPSAPLFSQTLFDQSQQHNRQHGPSSDGFLFLLDFLSLFLCYVVSPHFHSIRFLFIIHSTDETKNNSIYYRFIIISLWSFPKWMDRYKERNIGEFMVIYIFLVCLIAIVQAPFWFIPSPIVYSIQKKSIDRQIEENIYIFFPLFSGFPLSGFSCFHVERFWYSDRKNNITTIVLP